MDKKHFFRTAGKAAAAMLLAATMMTGFTSCLDVFDNADNSTSQLDGDGVEPTTDQMKVTVHYNMPTAVLSQFDDNSVGAALINRLSQTSSTIGDDTKLVLLDGCQVESLTDDDYYKMARVYMNGGYIALQRPTVGGAFDVALGIMKQVVEVQDDILEENGVEMSEEVANARSLVGEELVRKVSNARALTRGEDDDENALLDEFLIISFNASYMIPPYNEEEKVLSKSEDEDGQESEPVEQKVKNIQNPYRYGRMADGAASWLNTKEKEIRDAMKKSAAARGLTRADADQVINAMISCTDEFTISGGLWARDDQGRRYYRDNLSNTKICSWSVYDFGSKRDFYYVEEEHHIHMGGENSTRYNTLYWGPYRKEDWIFSADPNKVAKQFYIEGNKSLGLYFYYYGSWLNESTHAIALDGDGEINVEQSLPGTDNNQSTETIAIGQTDGTSHTSGWSFGGNFGANGGVSGSNGTGGGSLGFNFSYTDTNTEIHQTSFTMSTASVSKDLAISKNTHGTEVTWTYKAGHTPGVIWEKGWHEMAAPILTNDIDITNKVCWSVKNPSGSYSLSWYKRNLTEARYLDFLKSNSRTVIIGGEADRDFYLSAPRRFKKEWNSDVRVYGDKLKDDALEKFIQVLQSNINPTMFSDQFYVAESADDGVEVIKYNVGVAAKLLNKDVDKRDKIKYRAQMLGIEKFTVKWFPGDPALKEKLKDDPFIISFEVSNL